ncbi:hypothetical protein V1291_000833 [Nitrobacteraceae bacterium AZCC 1564]
MFVRIRKKIDILRHEAGHLVVGKLLGFETGSVRLTAKDAGAEITLAPHLADIDQTKDYIKRRVIVLYAGACAEALRGKKIHEPQVLSDLESDHATNDFAKIRELLLLLAGIEIDDDNRQDLLDKYVADYSNRAGELVEKYADTIHEVANDLAENISAEGMTLSKDKVDNLPSVRTIKASSERAASPAPSSVATLTSSAAIPR